MTEALLRSCGEIAESFINTIVDYHAGMDDVMSGRPLSAMFFSPVEFEIRDN